MSAHYIRVAWKHQEASEPIVLYSELDARRHELRKVEVFLDGRMGYACRAFERGGSRLAKMAMPALAELALDPQFEPHEITAREFEAAWQMAVRTRVDVTRYDAAYGP